MSRDYMDWDRRGGLGQHTTAAAVAFVFSIVMHIVGLFYLTDVRFDIAVSPDSVDEEAYEAMKIFNIERKPDSDISKADDNRETVFFREETAEDIDAPDVSLDKSEIEPPPTDNIEMAALLENMAQPSSLPKRDAWEPRQEILEIHEKIADDRLAVKPRRLRPVIERVAKAPDYVASVDMKDIDRFGGWGKGSPLGRPAGAKIDKGAAGKVIKGGTAGGKGLNVANPMQGKNLFEETLSEITNVKPIEKYLVSKTTVYAPLTDFRYGYFKIEIKRAGAGVLPVLPKDIIFVQDSSASITEQRLQFCRTGLQKCLEMMGPSDRFNVVSFKDKTAFCFPDWQENSSAAVDKAKKFVADLASDGNTDIYASMRDLTKVKREKGRPIVALVVTDGMANTGLTKSSNIIGQFTKLNKGDISVFMMGTTKVANNYLLDLMGYSNKGGVFEAPGGRWGIPEGLQSGMMEISRPVMSEVKFRFAASSKTEVYPLLASNLYLDRSMVLYGRYHKKAARSLVFQAVGEARDSRCDMLMHIPLDKSVEKGDKDIRTEWAKQKIYHLIGEYTRNPDGDTLKNIHTTARMYNVDIPYEGKF